MSRSKFYQQFKLAFGTSPALWQQQLRLKKPIVNCYRGARLAKRVMSWVLIALAILADYLNKPMAYHQQALPKKIIK